VGAIAYWYSIPIAVGVLVLLTALILSDDNASEDKIAKAFVLLSFCSPSSVDFNGLPIKNLAYGPEQILIALAGVGAIAYWYSIPIAVGVLVLLNLFWTVSN
jgi:hypothetical protein